MVGRLVFDFLAIALAAWFWSHCAKPALVFERAAPAAQRIVLGSTVLLIGAWALDAGAEFVPVAYGIQFWVFAIAGVLWSLVVGLGYLQNYALLRRVTGSPTH